MEELADSVDNYSPINSTDTNNWSKGKYFKLMNDINDSVRTVVGYARNTYAYAHYFQGFFDGNNKKIILAIDWKLEFWEWDGKWHSITRDYIGLFSALYKAEVYDLSIEGYVYGNTMVGGICGYANTGSIYNCVNECNVENKKMYTAYCLGGFCGLIREGIISDCINYGRIKSCSERVGGITGDMSGSNITNCINYGNISSSNIYVGGISGIGRAYENYVFSNCHNYGNVSGEHAVGGITGCLQTNSFPISHCTNTGNITATSAAGGIAGHMHDQAEISHCINIGTVRGESYVGGIASGYNNTKFSNEETINTCHNAGLIVGNNIIGGIAGYCTGEIRNCLNTGVVIGDTEVGAIVGKLHTIATTQNCHYDKQMCTHGGIAGNDVTGQAEGYLTKELIGNNLQTKLGNTDWTFDNANLYPTLKHFEKDSVAFVASSPVYLYDGDVADFDRQNRVKTDFKVNLENDVKWNRIIGNVDIVNDDGLVKSNGSDTLVCSIGNYKKLVPINIQLLPIGDVKFTIWATEHKQVSPTETNYSIPIYIKSNAKTLRATTIKKLIIEIDNRIFYAKHSDNGTFAGKNQNEITIENIKIPALNAGEEVVLFNLIGDVLLGNIDNSEIIINPNIEFAEELNSEPELKNGHITLNICHEGNDRFIEIADNSPSLIIKNNPLEDILEVECNVVESGKYALEIVDITGRSVKVKEFVAGKTGVFQFEIDVANFNAGKYVVVMVIPRGRIWTQNVVKE